MTQPLTDQPDVMVAREAWAFLRMGENQLYQNVRLGKIPHRRLGTGKGSLRFSRAALLKWLEGQ